MGKYFWALLYWVFGVGTCAYYAIETLNACMQTSYLLILFSPLLLIPVTNLLILSAPEKHHLRPWSLAVMGTLNGLSLVVSFILLTVLSPLVLLACFGMWIGFVSLSCWWIAPYCLYHILVAVMPAITSVAMRYKLKRMLAADSKPPWLPAGTCFATVLSTLLIALFPTALTSTCEASVASDKQIAGGLLLLRAAGDENEMLRACYNEVASMPWYFMASQFNRTENYLDKAREIYYRVKGKPFNTVPRPLGTNYNWDDYEYYGYLDWSKDFAGEAVGGVVQGLALTSSRLTGEIDADKAVSHMHWKMHFNNEKSYGTELRTQILLPPHAVVSGCSLWVNGKKCEAVIATRESARAAYEASARTGHKPLMVSTAGAGRVLLQSSTGSWGKDADLEVEITSPMELMDINMAALPLPSFAERNFSVQVPHQISFTSNRQILSAISAIKVSQSSGLCRAEGNVPAEALTAGAALLAHRDPNANAIAVPASNSAAEVNYFAEKIVSHKSSSRVPIVVVIDGSATMATVTSSVCSALSKLRCDDISVVWSSDTPIVVAQHLNSNSASWKLVVDKLLDSSCIGGQNNAEAICTALSCANASHAPANVVWIHGPQPVKFSGNSLSEKLDSASNNLTLYEYQAVNGPNEVVRSLDKSPHMVQVPRILGITNDLNRLFDGISGERATLCMERLQLPKDECQDYTKAGYTPLLGQLYTSDMVLASLAHPAQRTKMGTEAEKFHIVTPYTSALVLENQLEYQQLGVKQHSDSAGTQQNSNSGNSTKANSLPVPPGLNPLGGLIPVTPEPPLEWMMMSIMATGATCLWIRRRRQLRA